MVTIIQSNVKSQSIGTIMIQKYIHFISNRKSLCTSNVVGEAAILPIAEIGYPSPSGFTFARTSRQLSLDCPIYFYYVADAELEPL